MFPPGFLGSRADILIDIVTLSFIVILPILIISWRMARSQKDYVNHRRIQLWLGISLAIVVGIFEYDLKMSGGIFEITKGSIYEGTALLNWTIYIHTFFSILTSLIWVFLIIISLVKFGNPPRPNSFSRTHRIFGRAGMICMIMAGVTSPPLYYFGFVA
ncbi:MAG: hypothetical protein KJ040_00130 [Gammaproteobacteria bacterium]|nr:hypothetical protein [Gammaproteobacteria bacterium]